MIFSSFFKTSKSQQFENLLCSYSYFESVIYTARDVYIWCKSGILQNRAYYLLNNLYPLHAVGAQTSNRQKHMWLEDRNMAFKGMIFFFFSSCVVYGL